MARYDTTLLEAALAALPVGVVLLDGEDRIVLANRAAEETRGVQAGEIVGRHVLL